MNKAAVWFVVMIIAGLALQAVGVERGPLGRLVDAPDAAILKQFYGDLATVVSGRDKIETMAQFREVQRVAVDVLQKNGDFSGSLATLNEPINKILATALGDGREVPDEILDAETRSKLTAALREVSRQF